MTCPSCTNILTDVPSLRVLLLTSAAPANGAPKATQMYPIVRTSLIRSLPDMGPIWVELEMWRRLCMLICVLCLLGCKKSTRKVFGWLNLTV